VRRIALLLGLALGLPARAEEPVTPLPGTADVFRQLVAIFDVIQKHYIDPAKVRPEEAVNIAFREFIRSLDPEADLLTPAEYAMAKATTNTLPVSLAYRNGRVIIVTPRDGTAAQAVGVLPGDELLCEGRRLPAAQEWLRTNQMFGIHESGTSRSIAVSNNVPATGAINLKTLAPGVTYCRLPVISNPAAQELRTQLLQQNPHAIILDVRNNPGGSLDGALGCARLFLPAEDRIVALDYAQPEQRVGFVSDASPKFNGAVVLLVNGGTAAEAEVLAAALKDNGRAKIVGSLTFGRGWLYALYGLPDGSALRIPTSRYLTPSKQTFQRAGIAPDVWVDVPPDEARALTRAGYGSASQTNDAALTRAVELLSR
jgi:carboxyl-terminal processing protease